MSFRMLKALGVIAWQWGTYILKAFSGRFGFDILRISQIRTERHKPRQRERPWCVIIVPITRWDMVYTSAWGFQRCSVWRTGQCESLQDVDRVQNWLHAWARIKFCRYWLSVRYKWRLDALIPQCSQVITPIAIDSQEMTMRLFTTEWQFAVVDKSNCRLVVITFESVLVQLW